MSDLISCEELLKREKDLLWSAFVRGFCSAIEFVNQLPPAELKWIPVTECLPEDENEVIVTICDKSGYTPDYYSAIGIYSAHLNCWIVDMISENVIAWMPLPEPWRGDR